MGGFIHGIGVWLVWFSVCSGVGGTLLVWLFNVYTKASNQMLLNGRSLSWWEFLLQKGNGAGLGDEAPSECWERQVILKIGVWWFGLCTLAFFGIWVLRVA